MNYSIIGGMNKASIQSDFLAAKTKMSATIMNATGWQEGVIDPCAVGMDSVFCYVFDDQTKWIWSCSIPKDAFYAVLQKSESSDHSAFVACCGKMISDCAASDNLSSEMANDLAIALTAYIGKTKTYQLSERATKANHFVVIRYGSTNTLRPFALVGPARYLIAADSIQESMKQVIAMDSKNHPEWIVKS